MILCYCISSILAGETIKEFGNKSSGWDRDCMLRIAQLGGLTGLLQLLRFNLATWIRF